MTSLKRIENCVSEEAHKPEAGMWLLILLDMSTFTLLFVVGLWEISKNRAAAFADALQLFIPLGLLNTLVLLTSSYVVVLAVRACRAHESKKAARYLTHALSLAALFFIIKIIEYALEVRSGYGLTSSTFFSFYFVLTGIHLLHVIIGAILLNSWRIKLRRGQLPSERWGESVGVYWHMVDLLWIIIFALFYIGSNS